MAVQEKNPQIQTFTSNLKCQRCANPLQLKFSFKNTQGEIFDEISNSENLNASQDNRNALYGQFESHSMRNIMVPAHISEAASDFMVIGDLASLPLYNIQSLKITDTLLDLTSDQSTIDKHLCEECTDKIHDQMDSQLSTAESESNMYRQFLEELKNDDDDENDLEKLQAQLRESQMEVAILEAQLNKLEAKQKSTEDIRKSYEQETENMMKIEKKQWYECCQVKYKILLAEDGERSVNNQLLYAQGQLNKLSNINVFSTMFHIWHSGHFGTINNFRLGKLKKEKVYWPEINAAWGQTVLLLHSLATKINLTFVRYRLVPYGDHSYIVPLDNKTKYLPLYCMGGSTYVLDNKFDDAMVAFLDCLQQFKEEVKNSDKSFHLPYRMDKGKIEDKTAGKCYSIKIYLNSEEQWTKALKFMLTNLKWALVWVSTQFQDNAP